jgi:hypothetical protein
MENLISNALESGTGEVEVSCVAQRHRAEVSVLDRGAGIPPEIRSKVFDPFFTSKTKGSGIGLAVARRFVEAAGELELKDRPGGGTVAGPAAQEASEGLAVDDEKNIRESVERYLRLRAWRRRRGGPVGAAPASRPSPRRSTCACRD